MKKVIISLAVILGVASAAYAFTPGEAPKEETVAPHHNHTHVHELNAEEGHQRDIAGFYRVWHYLKCGRETTTYDHDTPSALGCPKGGSHNWQIIKRKSY